MSGSVRRVASLVGFATGGFVAGLAFWAIGYYGWVTPIRHPIVDLLAFVTVLVFPMSLVAPLALVRYLGRNVEGVLRWIVTLVGYALLVGATMVLAYAGAFEALGVDSAEKALAFFAAVFGATFGGIVGSKLASRLAGRIGRSDGVWGDGNGSSRWGEN